MLVVLGRHMKSSEDLEGAEGMVFGTEALIYLVLTHCQRQLPSEIATGSSDCILYFIKPVLVEEIAKWKLSKATFIGCHFLPSVSSFNVLHHLFAPVCSTAVFQGLIPIAHLFWSSSQVLFKEFCWSQQGEEDLVLDGPLCRCKRAVAAAGAVGSCVV